MAKLASRNITTTTADVADGNRYGVYFAGTDRRAYQGPGLPLNEAERLAETLLAPADVRLLAPDLR